MAAMLGPAGPHIAAIFGPIEQYFVPPDDIRLPYLVPPDKIWLLYLVPLIYYGNCIVLCHYQKTSFAARKTLNL